MSIFFIKESTINNRGGKVIRNQKGMTLIELVMVIVLIGVVGSGVTVGQRMLREVTLEAKVKEVVTGLEYIKRSAVATGQQYNVVCFENRVLVRRGIDRPLYTIRLGDHIKVPYGITGQWIRFKGTVAPSGGAATITLVDEILRKKVDITVGVATGKVRLYYKTL